MAVAPSLRRQRRLIDKEAQKSEQLEVTVRPQHLRVRCAVADDPEPEEDAAEMSSVAEPALQAADAPCEADSGTGTAADQGSRCTGGDGSSVNTSLVTLIDNALSGDVYVSDSKWTVSDDILVVDLLKKADYSSAVPRVASTGAAAAGATSERKRPPWWRSAVRGGKTGPEDPKKPPEPPNPVQRLDAKIGEQAQTKAKFEGKSKFQW